MIQSHENTIFLKLLEDFNSRLSQGCLYIVKDQMKMCGCIHLGGKKCALEVALAFQCQSHF